MAQLSEEVGEVARIIARRYGEQSEKESDKNKAELKEGDIINIRVKNISKEPPLYKEALNLVSLCKSLILTNTDAILIKTKLSIPIICCQKLP